ncbi:hypothetical protein EZ456_07920 [Pedobacter psychrodurus]|uniref:Uncharacterized protein n=1 Tax=Pedobacter psychrodurus TaxID=2530456 RepID=A0A4R0Q897_9SPHI|nr:hypothetical protein [Pedobacter psychrodurus]TCD27866.1 hypothetical protein EZ456_07920 [Pedobacter psychrodurus]
MNNTFNINRFGLLLKRKWLDFGKIYLMSLVVLTVVIVSFYLFNIPIVKQSNLRWNDNEHAQLGFRLPTFLMVGFLFLTIEASTYFSALGQKPKAIMELMTPASTTEKFLCAILFTTIISLISYLFIFYIIDALFLNYINELWENQKAMNYNTNKLSVVSFSTLFDDLTEDRRNKFLFAFPFFFSSIFLLGSVYFNRFHYIKTALTATAFFAFVIFLAFKAAKWLMEGKYNAGAQEKDFVFVILFVASVIVTFIIWAITHIRLKEKEV